MLIILRVAVKEDNGAMREKGYDCQRLNPIVDHPYGGVASDHKPPGEIIVVPDATATYTRSYASKDLDGVTLHTINLATLNNELRVVQSTEEVLRLLNSASQ
ncbi:hypothetical protein FHL15_003346 [Xylaria flabelliformis]|uniref:Uncharacterized protein n=1 Tax=Xylaria flabelliformis TaxID=2512241 RepID=A0A553I6G1_9PEZI|nr:hypothetical protein FHL15_003346 [Xylaria flabelliformis]